MPTPPIPADENQIIAERRGKLAARRAQGQAYPNDFRRDALASDLHARYDGESNEALEAKAITVTRRRPHDAEARDGQGLLRHAAGHVRAHPALRHRRRRGTGEARRLQALGPGRHRRRHGDAVQDAHRRAVDQDERRAAAGQVAAAAAGEVPRHDRPGAALPPALRRPHHQLAVARRVRQALADRAGDPRVLRRARLPRGRDADDASDPRRRGGAPVRDASQCARHGALPAHRTRALPEEARRRRHGEGVRDQPQLSQRRHLDPAQPRVHDARVLRGVPRLPLPHGPDRGADSRGGDQGARHHVDHLPGPGDRSRRAIRPPDDGRRRSTSTTRSTRRSRSRIPITCARCSSGTKSRSIRPTASACCS